MPPVALSVPYSTVFHMSENPAIFIIRNDTGPITPNVAWTRLSTMDPVINFCLGYATAALTYGAFVDHIIPAYPLC